MLQKAAAMSSDLPFPVRNPFVEALGLRLERFEGGQAEVSLSLQPEQLNAFGVAHGGVCMTMLDVAMAHAVRSQHHHEPEGGPGVVTVEMKTSFLQPAEGRLRACARVLHASATLAFVEGELLDPSGVRVAHATGTFKLMRRLPTRDRTVRQQVAAGPVPSD
jgi:uncharacterized protein (TIGR00369 family)